MSECDHSILDIEEQYHGRGLCPFCLDADLSACRKLLARCAEALTKCADVIGNYSGNAVSSEIRELVTEASSTVNGIDVFFYRLTGHIDGVGIAEAEAQTRGER